MPVRELLIWPNPVLKECAQLVLSEEFGSDALKALAQDLIDTCAARRGVGLAAPQIGVSKRVILVPGADNAPLVLINPSIRSASKTTITGKEGCLSIPSISLTVTRFKEIQLIACTISGQAYETTVTGVEAVAIQHECDHLDGITLCERVGPVQRDMVRRRLVKNKRMQARSVEVREKLLQQVKEDGTALKQDMRF